MAEESTRNGNPTVGYLPLERMQDKAAQLRQELEALAKSERHAQFKRHNSMARGAQGQSVSASRRLPRTMTSMSHGLARGPSASLVGPSAPRASTLAHGASFSSGLAGLGGAGERPTSALTNASRASSRRVSNASGVNTDASGDEGGPPRTYGSASRNVSPSRRHGARSPSRTAAYRDLQEAYQQAVSRGNQLEESTADLEARVRELNADNERRQESYMRREGELQAQLERVQDQLRVARGERPNHPAFGKATTNIRELHGQVVEQIEKLLDAQAAALRTEEHTTLRRFTQRLNELEAAVATERGKPKEDVDWLEKTMALRQELDTTQQIAQVLDKKHGLLAEENARLRSQFKLQEEDREYLIKQTVALKKENAALRNQLAAALQEVAAGAAEREELMSAVAAGGGLGGLAGLDGRPVSAGARPGTAPGSGAGAGGPDSAIQIKIQRYEDVIESLKRLLEGERRRTKQARAAHTAELQQRTGLQALLRQCIEDVRERRKAAEGDAARAQHSTDRAQARSRPLSGAPRLHTGVSVARPLSASLLTPTPAASLPSQARRPSSAAFGPGGTRPGSGRAAATAAAAAVRHAAGAWGLPSASGVLPPDAAPDGGSVGPGTGGSTAYGGADGTFALSARDREELVSTLLAHEEVLKSLFDRAFPGVAPHPPSDPYLDRMAAWQEQRDAQVVANAKVLAATKSALPPPAAALKEATPGGPLMKESAARPWVLNVDQMLAEFLGGGGAGGGGGGGAAGRGEAGVGAGLPPTATVRR
ncbi:hypothetical protein HYH03_000530 [Edaphochlamys debaryana]|uniref:Uncharacterized protein n=1 Tax=Edaphochlamys debaryana TaxID=47281 RepID=A0A835YGB5_9CHLO|nr:hypothetical protein HYH03_000530 [Edaphochlamys debaryana]|eukprot:KAG2502036.1 hypothetical protein HYH03_000530 [Edaphochlamys debaryana]